jgi:hypothetical protein
LAFGLVSVFGLVVVLWLLLLCRVLQNSRFISSHSAEILAADLPKNLAVRGCCRCSAALPSRPPRSVSPAPPRCRWGRRPTDSHLVPSDGPTLDVQRARACEHGHPAPGTTTAGGRPRACMGRDISPPRAAGALTSPLSDTAAPYRGLMAPAPSSAAYGQRLLLIQ